MSRTLGLFFILILMISKYLIFLVLYIKPVETFNLFIVSPQKTRLLYSIVYSYLRLSQFLFAAFVSLQMETTHSGITNISDDLYGLSPATSPAKSGPRELPEPDINILTRDAVRIPAHSSILVRYSTTPLPHISILFFFLLGLIFQFVFKI